MKGYVGEVLNDYAREGRRLYNDLFIDSRYEWGERGCRDYLDASARYKFISNMFSDMNCFGWRDVDFDIEETK